jgi:hypothetical protein
MKQQEHLKIDPKRSILLSFQPKLKINLADDENSCIDEESYSLTKCLKDYIMKEVGCSLNWFQNHGDPTCSSKLDILETQTILEWFQMSSWENLTAITGCFLKCEKSTYEMTVVSNQKVIWETEWISEVFIQPSSSSREEIIEYLSYDLGDIVGDLGGYLGLFLGWSLLSVTLYIPKISSKMWSTIKALAKDNIPLAPMGVLATGSAHTRPSAQPPIDTSEKISEL